MSCVCVQDQYEKAVSGLQQRVQELEAKLKGVQKVLQEKVQELKEQVSSAGSTGSAGSTPALLSVCSSAGEERKVERLVEGAVRGKCPANDSAASHRRAAEEGREEELGPGGKGQRPQQAAEGRRPRGPLHMRLGQGETQRHQSTRKDAESRSTAPKAEYPRIKVRSPTTAH